MVDEFAILAEGAPIVATLGSPKIKSRRLVVTNAALRSPYDFTEEIVVFAASDEASPLVGPVWRSSCSCSRT